MARLLHTAALRLRKHTQRSGAFQAWNKCLGHLLALARAHIESIVYSRFSLAVTSCPDADARKSLKVGLDAAAAQRLQLQALVLLWSCAHRAVVGLQDSAHSSQQLSSSVADKRGSASDL